MRVDVLNLGYTKTGESFYTTRYIGYVCLFVFNLHLLLRKTYPDIHPQQFNNNHAQFIHNKSNVN